MFNFILKSKINKYNSCRFKKITLHKTINYVFYREGSSFFKGCFSIRYN